VTPGSISQPHRYGAPGLYTVKVTVTDDDGGASTSTYQYVVVYDPNAGSVNGSGWMPTSAGKAEFGFDVRYRRGATTPSGTLTFVLPGTLFKATAFDWLVVTPTGATYVRGHGTVDGKGGYSFLLAVADGGPGESNDRLRMKIWSDATSAVVFDNQPGGPDDAVPVSLLGGGSLTLLK